MEPESSSSNKIPKKHTPHLEQYLKSKSQEPTLSDSCIFQKQLWKMQTFPPVRLPGFGNQVATLQLTKRRWEGSVASRHGFLDREGSDFPAQGATGNLRTEPSLAAMAGSPTVLLKEPPIRLPFGTSTPSVVPAVEALRGRCGTPPGGLLPFPAQGQSAPERRDPNSPPELHLTRVGRGREELSGLGTWVVMAVRSGLTRRPGTPWVLLPPRRWLERGVPGPTPLAPPLGLKTV